MARRISSVVSEGLRTVVLVVESPLPLALEGIAAGLFKREGAQLGGNHARCC